MYLYGVGRFLFFILVLLSYKLSSQDIERKYSLYYANDSYELTLQHHLLLDSLKSLEHKELYDVHIKGYTNNIGPEDYNKELSRKRAQNVHDELKEFTIISSMGYGELASEAPDNRRVDVFIHLQKFHVAAPDEIVIKPMPKTDSIPILAKIEQPKIGDRVILRGIRFYPDQDVIMNESRDALEDLLRFLKKYPNVRFKLMGHICCGDSERPHMDLRNTRTGKTNLSEARAKSVYNYLLKHGISNRRMRYLGMAYRNPTGKGDDYDRRVEIEITHVE